MCVLGLLVLYLLQIPKLRFDVRRLGVLIVGALVVQGALLLPASPVSVRTVVNRIVSTIALGSHGLINYLNIFLFNFIPGLFVLLLLKTERLFRWYNGRSLELKILNH